MSKLVVLHLISLSSVLFFLLGLSSSQGSAHCAVMVHPAAFPTCHTICWTSSGWVVGSAVSACVCLPCLSHLCSIGLLCCPYDDMFICNFLCLASGLNFTEYFVLHVFIIEAIYKLFFYSPFLLFIFTFNCC